MRDVRAVTCALGLALLAGPALAQNPEAGWQSAWDEFRTPVPAAPTPADAIGIQLSDGGQCLSEPFVQPGSVRIRQTSHVPGSSAELDEYTYELSYEFDTDVRGICAPVLPPMPPQRLSIADLGRLPPGKHSIEVRGLRGSLDSVEYKIQEFQVRNRATVRNDVTGAWHSPEHVGQGFSVMRQEQLLVAYWNIHDSQGAPVWLLFVSDQPPVDSSYSGVLYNTRGSANGNENQIFGSGRFTYLGCGRAHWQWTPNDPSQGGGEQNLVQLLVPDGIQRCDFSPWQQVIRAQWL